MLAKQFTSLIQSTKIILSWEIGKGKWNVVFLAVS